MKKVLLACAVTTAFLASVMFALEEKDVKEKMKAACQSMNGLRKSMQAKSMPDVATHAKSMVTALSGVEEFWKARNMANAAKWQVEGAEAAKALAVAADAGDADAVRAAMGKVGSSCKQCHEAHREKIGENEYKIKP
jgi:cytochrome c556